MVRKENQRIALTRRLLQEALLRLLSRFPEAVEEACLRNEPSIVTRYILDVAADYNRFYHNCPILTAEDEDVIRTRVRLTEATKTVLGNAFPLICLKTLEKI